MIARLAFLLIGTLLWIPVADGNPTAHPDPRFIENGHIIYKNGYTDQPYVVVLPDKSWLCIFTTSSTHEGNTGQHIAATRSFDKGRTWSAPVHVEPPSGPAASWAVPYVTSYGRVYAFYTYNGDNITQLKGENIRNDMLGWYCYKYSDDYGQTWSERYRLPMKVTEADRKNDWQGTVQIFWGISKPVKHKEDVYFAFTKLGKYMLDEGEGWVYRSNNLDKEKDVTKLNWEELPEGDKGLRHDPFGSVQEEHNLVVMNNGDLYMMYRTVNGFPVHLYGRMKEGYWTQPEMATHSPGGKRIRHPRACPRIWKAENGKYLLWYHNHGGKWYDDRNPAWIAGGVEKDGHIYWSEPEILLYSYDYTPKTGRMSYPDLIEQDGRYWITQTQKTTARVHEVEPKLLEGLWNQASNRHVTTNGLMVSLNKEIGQQPISITSLPNLQAGSFSIDVWLNLKELKPGEVILSSMNTKNAGLEITAAANSALEIKFGDGVVNSFTWTTDTGLVSAGKLHNVIFTIDGLTKIITVVVDGKLCDGGELRTLGWGRFEHKMGDVRGTSVLRVGEGLEDQIISLRIYNRYLRTSEAIANYNAGKKGIRKSGKKLDLPPKVVAIN